MTDSFQFSVLTLNCWGIPFISSNRRERIQEIGHLLSKSAYDVCILQEIWSQDDYKKLATLTQNVYSHSHYFYSGVTGSGVCLFSKHLIEDVVINRYSLNGYAHKVYHGDWFGGKLAGLCSVTIKNVTFHLYATHVHAEYGRDNDEYLAHRVAQILELCQFIRYTRKNADICILAGDMNVEPVDLGYRMLLHHGQLCDAWVHQKNNREVDGVDGHTNGLESNSYTAVGDSSKRIDYIFYSSNGKYTVECENCETTMHTIPGKNISYSDHAGVVAYFNIFPSNTFDGSSCPLPLLNNIEREKAWEESLTVFHSGLQKTVKDQQYFYILMIIGIVLKFIIEFYEFPHGTRSVIYIMKLIIIVSIAIWVWMAVIMCRAEKNGLLSAATTINTMKNAGRDKKKDA